MELINAHEDFQRYYNRIRIAAVGAALLFFVLLGRYVWLQIIQRDHYHTLAENNRITLLPAAPARGAIYDRNGTVLAQNFSARTLEITPDKTTDVEETINRLSAIVQIDPADRKRFKRLLAENKHFASIPIRYRLTEEEEARFAVNRFRFPGVEVRARLFRQYPFGDSFAHVVGYIGRVNPKDVEQLAEQGQGANYRGTDHIGKLGIEKSYEPWLHGATGIEKVEVDSSGKAVRVLSQTRAMSGSNIHLHLDTGLQQAAEAAFGEMRGALVALDPRNGSVLALVSKPGFDPNLFIDGIDPASWRELNDNPDRPMINRALRGLYPPGSTIKPFMAMAALELGVRKPSDTIHDPGFYSLPGSRHRFRDWKAGGHGLVDLHKSLVISCDSYYYQLSYQLGIQRMHDFLDLFGFGQKSGIDLDGEKAGVLPSPAWKKSRFKQEWLPGETIIAGIGQGYNLTTPLQLAVATMAIANDGTVYKPQLIRAWSDPVSGRNQFAAPEIVRKLNFNPEHLRVVKEAMIAVNQPGGTASGASAGAPYLIAGKTGTAQVVGIKQNERYVESRVAKHHRDHALFIAFAPADAPRIVVAVMVENGGHGGSTAAPVARKTMDYWLLGKKPAHMPGTPAAPVAPTPAAPEAAPVEEQEDSAPADPANLSVADRLREEALKNER